MGNTKTDKKSIELFHSKSGRIIRIIRFKNDKDFNNFLDGFNAMRYPNYNWRFSENAKRKETTHQKSD